MKITILAKIIAATMMIIVVLFPMSVAFAVDADGDGVYEDLTTSASFAVSSTNTALSGYNVLVTGDGGYGGYGYEDYITGTATRIRGLGASVTEADPLDLTSDMLAQHDVVWITVHGAGYVDSAGKANIIKSYVYNGGGLILEQPNEVITPQCLPYVFQIVSSSYENTCTATILAPDHYLTQNLSSEDMPVTGDEVGTIGPEWTVLAIDSDETDPDPNLSVANYGAGRIIVELAVTINKPTVCGYVSVNDILLERMIKWVAAGAPIEVEVDIKPGSYPNSINLGSHGLIPAAILSSEEFAATTVDPETVELAGSGVSVRGKSNKYMAHEEDVNGDGLVDLVVQVATENLDPESFQDGYAILTGSLYEGQKIEGFDEISVVPTE